MLNVQRRDPAVETMTYAPDFFIAGAMKGGTTSIAVALRQHPDIYFSPIKEPNYFCQDIDTERFSTAYRNTLIVDPDAYVRGPMNEPVHQAFVRNPETYKRLFEAAEPGQVTGEASVSYLVSREAPPSIAATRPDAKIVIVLRHPVERAFSHYLMDLAIGITNPTFIDALDKDLSSPVRGWGVSKMYIEAGLYAEQVQRYFTAFGRDQVMVVFHEELVADFRRVMVRICRHIGVDPARLPLVFVHENGSKLPRFHAVNRILHRMGVKRILSRTVPRPLLDAAKTHYYREGKGPERLTDEARQYLMPYFEDDILNLGQVLRRDTRSWLNFEPLAV